MKKEVSPELVLLGRSLGFRNSEDLAIQKVCVPVKYRNCNFFSVWLEVLEQGAGARHARRVGVMRCFVPMCRVFSVSTAISAIR